MRRIAVLLSVTLGALVVWQVSGDASGSVKLLISTPSEIGKYFWFNRVDLAVALRTTAMESLAGLVIAAICSFSMGVLCLYFPRVVELILPVLVSVQVVPLVVFAPFVVLVFGVGFLSKAALAAVIAFFPLFLTFFRGYERIGLNVHDLLDIYEAGRSFRIFHVFIPLATPSIFSGLKVAATLAVLGAVVAEFTGATVGIGKDIFLTTIRIEPELMVLSIIASAFIGGGLYLLVDVIENVLGRWYM
jgi:NitT/TauT family transport system permease protein